MPGKRSIGFTSSSHAAFDITRIWRPPTSHRDGKPQCSSFVAPGGFGRLPVDVETNCVAGRGRVRGVQGLGWVCSLQRCWTSYLYFQAPRSQRRAAFEGLQVLHKSTGSACKLWGGQLLLEKTTPATRDAECRNTCATPSHTESPEPPVPSLVAPSVGRGGREPLRGRTPAARSMGDCRAHAGSQPRSSFLRADMS